MNSSPNRDRTGSRPAPSRSRGQVNRQGVTRATPVTPETRRMPRQRVDDTAIMPKADLIGPYRVLDKVGEGGMGVVYRAADTRVPGKLVALKVLRPHIAYDPSARTRLAREVATLERVHSPHVAAVIDADPDGERPYIATQYVPGTPLDKVIDENGPFLPEQLSALGRGLAQAIAAIHSAGVVHRDLKPSNVLMVGNDPIVIDFGIAHLADDARLTSTGLVMGTPGYLSPELVEGAPVSTSTDWWGWAAILAFAAQGSPPFGRGPMPVILDRVTRGQCDLSGVDERLRPLLAAALSPVPSRRPSARQVLDQIDRYARGEYTSAVPVRAKTQPIDAPAATRVAPQHVSSSSRSTQDTSRSGAPDSVLPNSVPPHQVAGSRGRSAGGERLQAQPVRTPQKSQVHPGEHDPRIHLPARSGVLTSLFILWLAVTTLAPAIGVTLLVVWNIAARFTDSTVTSTVLRRFESGRRRSDGPIAVASSPWHLMRALIATAAAFLMPCVVGACVGAILGIGWAALGHGVARAWWGLPIFGAALTGQWAMWRGASSTSYRRGSRSLARAIAPNSPSSQVLAGLLSVVGLLMFAASLRSHGQISWAPLPGGYRDPLTTYLPNLNSGV